MKFTIYRNKEKRNKGHQKRGLIHRGRGAEVNQTEHATPADTIHWYKIYIKFSRKYKRQQKHEPGKAHVLIMTGKQDIHVVCTVRYNVLGKAEKIINMSHF